MAVARVKVWIAGEVLTASDLNAEFNNLIDNALTLVSPWTANMDAGGFRLITLGAGTVGSPTLQPTGDTNTGVYFPAADQVSLAGGGVQILQASAYVSAVNFLRVVPGQTTRHVQIQAGGSDTNISLQLVPAGTGYVTFPVGAAATPSLSFGTDNDTGWYANTQNQLSLSIAGTQAFQFTSSQLLNLASNARFEAGSLTAANTPALRFHSSGTNKDHDANIECSGGSASGHTGTADLTINAGSITATGYMVFGSVTGTPAQHGLYRDNVPKAWVSWSTTPTLLDSFNVTSITDNAGTGDVTVTFDRDFAAITYCPVGMASFTTVANILSLSDWTLGAARFLIYDHTGTLRDASGYVAFFGDQ